MPPGSRRIVRVAGRSVGIFNVNGEYFALRNRCPHQGGPLCLGSTTGIATSRFVDADGWPEVIWEREGEILRCPWHAWEFDMRTGEAVFGQGWRVKVYPVRIQSGPSSKLDGPDADEAPVQPAETYRTSIEGGTLVIDIPD